MTEVVVLQQSPSHFSSTSSSSSSSSSTKPCAQNDEQSPRAHMTNTSRIQEREVEEEEEEEEICRKERESYQQVSVVELLLAAFRKSVIGPCSAIESRDFCSPSSSSSGSGSGSGSSSRRIMEIGWPSNVRHIAHVTFDRFNGFLGLPDDFEPQVPRRPPSASANVFGVSTESMQLSFDSRGNSVPTILLMMQRHLYAHGGLQIEGIFRINGGNSQEEYVRDQLNSGVIPDDIDIHCLAGLIKAWFRELPRGLLDTISPEQVMQSQSEEECVRLVRLLPPAEAALLDWAVNLMADVSQFEHANKMNPRNIAMVFAPNMTQMADPLTALMYAVQVMNFLKTLIIKTLRERADTVVETSPKPRLGASGEDDDAHQQTLSSQTKDHGNNKQQEIIVENENNSPSRSSSSTSTTSTGGDQSQSFLSSIENIIPSFESIREPKSNKSGQLSTSSSLKRGFRKTSLGSSQKNNKTGILGRINSRKELVEAWR